VYLAEIVALVHCVV